MRLLPSALLLAASLACASSPAPVRAPSSASADTAAIQLRTPRPRRNANVITRDELVDPALQGATALDAVRRLRPNFLANHGAVSLTNPGATALKVSMDGINLGPLDDLDRVRTNEIRSIRYLTASDATQRFGITSGGAPVIIVERM